MTNAAIYARFSSDQQSDSSIEAQERLCRIRADALAVDVVAVFSDRAVSGSIPVARRPGGRAMLSAAESGQFSVLIIEGLDRLSRDSVESEMALRDLEFRGVRIVGVADGYDTTSGKGRKLLRGVRGLLNEAYLDDLREKVHRTLSHKAASGFHVAGISYGYRSIATGVGRYGEPADFRLEVVPESAEVVREIFDRYGAGESCQRIAADLNARRVKGPRGGTWSVSAIYGTPGKGAGLLNNEAYIGRYVWNRSRWVKHPETGKRTRFERPRGEWMIDERSELRIVTDTAWQRVRLRIGAGSARELSRGNPGALTTRRTRGGAATTLFGGLLRCAKCGGPMIAVNARQYGCAARKDRGVAVCAGTYAPRSETDQRLVATVRDTLSAPEAIAEVRREAAAGIAALGDAGGARRDRVAGLDAEISRLVDAVAQLGLSGALRERLTAAEAERAQLLALPCSPRVPSVDEVVAHYRRGVLALASVLEREVTEARVVLAEMLGRITIEQRGDEVWAEMETRREPLMLAAGAYPGLVAGEGFEPSTFGL